MSKDVLVSTKERVFFIINLDIFYLKIKIIFCRQKYSEKYLKENNYLLGVFIY